MKRRSIPAVTASTTPARKQISSKLATSSMRGPRSRRPLGPQRLVVAKRAGPVCGPPARLPGGVGGVSEVACQGVAWAIILLLDEKDCLSREQCPQAGNIRQAPSASRWPGNAVAWSGRLHGWLDNNELDEAFEGLLQGRGMNLDESVTIWIDGLRQGSELSAQQLWERYFSQLVRIAGKKLPRGVRRDFDEEDVAISAFHSLCEGVRGGRFPRLEDRDNLWSLLVVITARKAMHRMRAATAQKRGGGDVQGESAFFGPPAGDRPQPGIHEVIGREPTAQFAAEICEESERLLALLPDEAMRQLALLKMEGHSNKEAAAQLNCGVRTVERRLGLIRKIWEART